MNAQQGVSTGPLLDVALAQTANRLIGTNLGPWDIPELDDATLDLLRALAKDVPKLQQSIARVEAKKDEFRRQFKTYRH